MLWFVSICLSIRIVIHLIKCGVKKEAPPVTAVRSLNKNQKSNRPLVKAKPSKSLKTAKSPARVKSSARMKSPARVKSPIPGKSPTRQPPPICPSKEVQSVPTPAKTSNTSSKEGARASFETNITKEEKYERPDDNLPNILPPSVSVSKERDEDELEIEIDPLASAAAAEPTQARVRASQGVATVVSRER